MSAYFDESDDFIMKMSKLEAIEDRLTNYKTADNSQDQSNGVLPISDLVREIGLIKEDILTQSSKIEEIKTNLKEFHKKQINEMKEQYEVQLASQKVLIDNLKNELSDLQIQKIQSESQSFINNNLPQYNSELGAKISLEIKADPNETLDQFVSSETSQEMVSKLKQQISQEGAMIKQYEQEMQQLKAKERLFDTMTGPMLAEQEYEKKCQTLERAIREETVRFNLQQENYINTIRELEDEIHDYESELIDKTKFDQLVRITEKEQKIILEEEKQLVKEDSIIKQLREVEETTQVPSLQLSQPGAAVSDGDRATAQLQISEQVIIDLEEEIMKLNKENRKLKNEIYDIRLEEKVSQVE